MKQKIASINFPKTINLNVGGRLFKTSLKTLQREESMLSKMFSGSGFKVEPDEDGHYFIDRPGIYFEMILNYLQTGTIVPPSNPLKLKALLQEVDFYQIESLLQLLKVTTFTYESLKDKKGILYWLGTSKGTSTYKNPTETNLVSVTNAGNSACAVGCEDTNTSDGGGCNSWLNKYFEVSLSDIVVVPSSYSLSYASDAGCHRPYNWKIEGMNLKNQWVTLRQHASDYSLQSENRANWSLTCSEKLKSFKITCTGRDVGGSPCYCFHVCNFEVYGTVT